MLTLNVFLFLASFAFDKELLFEDRVYEEQIKTVRLFPTNENPEAKILPAVTSMGGTVLQLEFDDLQSDKNNYFARIISCNYDWTKSRLHDLDFLSDYNEFNINDYTYSSNTHIPYVHYRFLLPTVKIPGNYLLVIYRDGDKSDLILTKRFMVSSNRVTVMHEANFGLNTLRATNQQINFTLNYNGLDIPNPLETVHVVIRQNQRWDNAQTDIKPSFVREGNKTMEYRVLHNDKGFQAGNEFRFIDFGSLNSPGQNTGRLLRDRKPFLIYVATDQPRDGQRYAQPQFRDLNGNYIIANYDMGSGEDTGNYVSTIFTLQSPRPYNSKVYVMGAFNNWTKEPANEMKFSGARYTCEMLLKQGFYSYCYLPENPSESVEGNYYETENQYEILIYNHSFFPEADMLVGYYRLTVNGR
jgi:Domain of unknown function (DUF5103)